MPLSLGREFELLNSGVRPFGLLGRLFGPRRTAPLLPPNVRVYAIGDIHGCSDLLARAMAAVATEVINGPERQYLVLLGDYVDRGPDSRGVIDMLISGIPGGVSALCLRGNHDQSMLAFLDDPMLYRIWKRVGGQETLLSYGVAPPLLEDDGSLADARDAFAEAVPDRHIQFLESLPYFARIGGYLFVHAGFRPGLPIAKQRRDDMLWIRREFLETRCDFGGTVVYGHTPGEQPMIDYQRIGLDTGAYATGKLTLALLEGNRRDLYAISRDDVRKWDNLEGR